MLTTDLTERGPAQSIYEYKKTVQHVIAAHADKIYSQAI